MNAPGTQAWPGAISGHRLVYQELALGVPGGSDIKLFDLKRKRRFSPPPGVNTAAWEGHPSLSGSWLMFDRIRGETTSIFGRNLKTGNTIELLRRRTTCRWSRYDPSRGGGRERPLART